MAITRQFFYRLTDSNNPVTVEVKIFDDPGTISVSLDQVQIGAITTNTFPITTIGNNSNLRGKTLMVVANIIDFNPENQNASVEVTLKGGVKDRVITEPVMVPMDNSTFLIFFISFVKPANP